MMQEDLIFKQEAIDERNEILFQSPPDGYGFNDRLIAIVDALPQWAFQQAGNKQNLLSDISKIMQELFIVKKYDQTREYFNNVVNSLGIIKATKNEEVRNGAITKIYNEINSIWKTTSAGDFLKNIEDAVQDDFLLSQLPEEAVIECLNMGIKQQGFLVEHFVDERYKSEVQKSKNRQSMQMFPSNPEYISRVVQQMVTTGVSTEKDKELVRRSELEQALDDVENKIVSQNEIIQQLETSIKNQLKEQETRHQRLEELQQKKASPDFLEKKQKVADYEKGLSDIAEQQEKAEEEKKSLQEQAQSTEIKKQILALNKKINELSEQALEKEEKEQEKIDDIKKEIKGCDIDVAAILQSKEETERAIASNQQALEDAKRVLQSLETEKETIKTGQIPSEISSDKSEEEEQKIEPLPAFAMPEGLSAQDEESYKAIAAVFVAGSTTPQKMRARDEIKRLFNVNVADKEGIYLIERVVAAPGLELVLSELLKKNIDLNLPNHSGRSILEQALNNKTSHGFSYLQQIAEKAPEELKNRKDMLGNTIIHLIAKEKMPTDWQEILLRKMLVDFDFPRKKQNKAGEIDIELISLPILNKLAEATKEVETLSSSSSGADKSPESSKTDNSEKFSAHNSNDSSKASRRLKKSTATSREESEEDSKEEKSSVKSNPHKEPKSPPVAPPPPPAMPKAKSEPKKKSERKETSEAKKNDFLAAIHKGKKLKEVDKKKSVGYTAAEKEPTVHVTETEEQRKAREDKEAADKKFTDMVNSKRSAIASSGDVHEELKKRLQAQKVSSSESEEKSSVSWSRSRK